MMCRVGGTYEAQSYEAPISWSFKKLLSVKSLVIGHGHMRLGAEEKGLVLEKKYKDKKGIGE
jgi:hypothetical protein